MKSITLNTIIAFGLFTVPLASSQRDAGVSQGLLDALQDWRQVVSDFNFLSTIALDGVQPIEGIATDARNLIDRPSREINALNAIDADSQGTTNEAKTALQKLKEGLAGDTMFNFLDAMSNSQDPAEIAQKAREMTKTRCCDLYPQIDIVWKAAASEGGISDLFSFEVARPRICREPLFCATDLLIS